jgi:hypothetical protein
MWQTVLSPAGMMIRPVWPRCSPAGYDRNQDEHHAKNEWPVHFFIQDSYFAA